MPFLHSLLTILAAGTTACLAEPNGGSVEPPDLEIAQCFGSPSGAMTIHSQGGRLTLLKGDGRHVLGEIDGGHVYWSPGSGDLVYTDNEGSGQSSRLFYVNASAGAPAPSAQLHRSAVDLFARWFSCHGPDFYANVWVQGWAPDGRLRLIVQDGVHSEGCAALGGTLGLLAEPRTGRILRVLEEREFRREWCTREERVQHGVCYDQALAASLGHPGRVPPRYPEDARPAPLTKK